MTFITVVSVVENEIKRIQKPETNISDSYCSLGSFPPSIDQNLSLPQAWESPNWTASHPYPLPSSQLSPRKAQERISKMNALRPPPLISRTIQIFFHRNLETKLICVQFSVLNQDITFGKRRHEEHWTFKTYFGMGKCFISCLEWFT